MNSNAKLHLSFDVGHSSIGWAAFEDSQEFPLLGTGAVTFPVNDCLASKRRDYRRQRRHIRATRQRISRIKILLSHLGVLSKENLDRPGSAWPWKLAAQAYTGAQDLTWPELWDVLRWYAHNRGYDGNRAWMSDPASAAEDTEKEENAKELLRRHKVQSMAEAFCAELDVPLDSPKRSSVLRFKGLNAAFPRQVVIDEVRKILHHHEGKLPGVDSALIQALVGTDFSDVKAWQAVNCPEIRLPGRYQGSLLFGQLLPRFENRIISSCPITYEKIYRTLLEDGIPEEKAALLAEKRSKVPAKKDPSFLRFRWAMQMANVRIKLNDKQSRPLNPEELKELDLKMSEAGYLTPGEFKEAVRKATGGAIDNMEALLSHPEAKQSLILDPVKKLLNSEEVKDLFAALPRRAQIRIRGKWLKGRSLTLSVLRQEVLDNSGDIEAVDKILRSSMDLSNKRKRANSKPHTPDSWMQRRLQPEFPMGRAPFTREMLNLAVIEVLEGKHPLEKGGCLEQTGQVRTAQLHRAVDRMTNNHLIRHRLLILRRLSNDILKEFAAGDKERVGRITIEVNRDLRELSGKTAKEQAQDLGLRLSDHKKVSEALEEKLEGRYKISASLIRKARIAEDLDRTCPYTGATYDEIKLARGDVDLDHIIPRSLRPSDSLDSLVVTFPAVNRWKGKRTALQFVEEEGGKAVPGMENLHLMTPAQFRKYVDGLKTRGPHPDDERRRKRRRDLLLLRDYVDKEFTPGDLTVTSHLVRMGAEALKRDFQAMDNPPPIISLPGTVTGTVRKGWNDVLGCLAQANPLTIGKTKTEIRDISHLHHAVDACVLGLASKFIPNSGSFWNLLVRRNLNEKEKAELFQSGLYDRDSEGRLRLKPLSLQRKSELSRRLAECRVVQHIPAEWSGLKAEETVWRVLDPSDQHPSAQKLRTWCAQSNIEIPAPESNEALIVKRVRKEKGTLKPGKCLHEGEKFWWAYDLVPKQKLIGLQSGGKLSRLKAVKMVGENFGVTLEDPRRIIPYFQVAKELLENRLNVEKILRNGDLIRISGQGDFSGVWKVFSTKNASIGLLLDIGRPDVVRLQNKIKGHKINVRLKSLMKEGLEILKPGYTGSPL